LVCGAALAGVIGATAAIGQNTTAETPTAGGQRHPVIVRKPDGAPSVATGKTNFLGQPVVASCSSCHTTTKPNPDLRDSQDLDQFHQGLKYVHGGLTCLSCHNASNYDTLKLADGRSIDFSDSIALCSQCHGPQRRDYDQGLHGGMRGYWDLSRGGRERNTCVNCHDPHAPAFPAVMPVLPPKDRVSVPREPSHTATATVSH
jgi:cytochrome c553